MKICKLIAKAVVKWLLVVLPFGWLCFTAWACDNATLGSLLVAAIALLATMKTMNVLGAALDGLLSEKERMELNGELHM